MINQKFRAMSEGGQILALILDELKNRTVLGMPTKNLDDYTRRLCLKYKAKPSFLGYQGYPAAVCVSINDEIVHGIPGKRVIKENDLVSLDLGIFYGGYHTDATITFGLGNVSKKSQKLIDITKTALERGIEQAVAGNHIGDISEAVQSFVEENGFNVIRALVGHCVGENIHEDPLIPNFGTRRTGPRIKKDMALAIEPMVTSGSYEVFQAEDNWTYKTSDQSSVAHFEHTVYVTGKKPIILTRKR